MKTEEKLLIVPLLNILCGPNWITFSFEILKYNWISSIQGVENSNLTHTDPVTLIDSTIYPDKKLDINDYVYYV